MLVSYLVTSHNETNCLDKLLSILVRNKKNNEIVLLDDYSTNPETLQIIEKHKNNIKLVKHNLNTDYGSHKNFGIDNCKGKWIFQLDADEYPTQILVENIDEIVIANDNNEVIWIPRLNFFEGLTQGDVKTWGWSCNTFKDLICEKIIDDKSEEYKLLKNMGLILEENRNI